MFVCWSVGWFIRLSVGRLEPLFYYVVFNGLLDIQIVKGIIITLSTVFLNTFYFIFFSVLIDFLTKEIVQIYKFLALIYVVRKTKSQLIKSLLKT